MTMKRPEFSWYTNMILFCRINSPKTNDMVHNNLLNLRSPRYSYINLHARCPGIKDRSHRSLGCEVLTVFRCLKILAYLMHSVVTPWLTREKPYGVTFVNTRTLQPTEPTCPLLTRTKFPPSKIRWMILHLRSFRSK